MNPPQQRGVGGGVVGWQSRVPEGRGPNGGPRGVTNPLLMPPDTRVAPAGAEQFGQPPGATKFWRRFTSGFTDEHERNHALTRERHRHHCDLRQQPTNTMSLPFAQLPVPAVASLQSERAGRTLCAPRHNIHSATIELGHPTHSGQSWEVRPDPA